MTDSPMHLSTIGTDKYPIWEQRTAELGGALNEIWRLSRFGGTDPAAPLRAACAAAVADLDLSTIGWISPVTEIQYGKGTLTKRLPVTAARTGSRVTRSGEGPR